MSRLVGKELPEELYVALQGNRPAAQSGKAIAIATVDPHNFAHPALLDYTGVVAKDPANIRLAVDSNSRTAGNIRQNSRLTIIVIDQDMAYYIKGITREIRSSLECSPSQVGINMGIEEILEDTPTPSERELGVRITSGVTFAAPRGSDSGAGQAEVLRELLSIP